MKNAAIYGLLGLGVLGGGGYLLSPSSLSQTPSVNEQVQGETTKSCAHSCDGVDLDCGDFSTHADAQEFFDCCGFSADNDPMKLDSLGVGDGIACESN